MIEELDENQKLVVNSSSNFLLVNAGPGTGKTHTLAHYLINQKNIPSDKKIIVSSFTNVGTKEIKERFLKYKGDNIKENYIFITVDSFFLNEIIPFYINRILKYYCEKFRFKYEHISWKNVSPTYKSKYKWLEYENLSGATKESLKKLWVENLLNSTLEAGYMLDIMLYEFLEKHDEFIQKLQLSYHKFVIDEAQDLNKSKWMLLNLIRKNTDIGVTLVGDPNQTLYQFLGSEETFFDRLALEYKGNVELVKLTKNWRYKGNNQEIKGMIHAKDEREFKRHFENWNSTPINNLFQWITSIMRKPGENKIFIICNTNVEVEKLYNNLYDLYSHCISCTLSIPQTIRNQYEPVEIELGELLFCLMKLHNGEWGQSWRDRIRGDIIESVENIINRESSEEEEIPLLLLLNNEEALLNEVKKMMGCDLNKLFNLYKDKPHYISILSPKRIHVMTVHASKGLEADYIAIDTNIFGSYKLSQKQSFNKIFVAITRVVKDIVSFNKINGKGGISTWRNVNTILKMK